MNGEAARRICESAWKRARLIAWLMLVAPALYVVVGLTLLRSGRLPPAGRSPSAGEGPRLARLDERLHDPIFFIVVAASVVDFLAAAVLRRGLLSVGYVRRRLNSMGQVAQHYAQVHVLVAAMCQTPALMGLVYLLLTGEMKRMVICAAAGVLFSLILLPRRVTLDRLLQVVGRRGPTSC